MLNGSMIFAASLIYLGLLFAVAWWGDKRADQGRSIIANPTIYAPVSYTHLTLPTSDLV